jgi:DNA polymerase-3 subunit beta
MLAENINRSIFATAQDELRPVMNGIYFDLTPECLAVVASDGHKLVRNKILNISSEQPASFILPKKPAALLKGVLGKQGGDVVIRFDDRNAEVTFEDGVLICRLIEGRYPNYNSVIPQNNPHRLEIDRLAMRSSLRRISPFASDSSQLGTLRRDGDHLMLSAQDYDFSRAAEEQVTLLNAEDTTLPDGFEIGFKLTTMIELLDLAETDNVILHVADPGRAMLLTEEDRNSSLTLLIMPMLING